MKTIAGSVFALILTATSSLAGNCAKHNQSYVMSGWLHLGAEAETCVQDINKINVMAGRSVQPHQHPSRLL